MGHKKRLNHPDNRSSYARNTAHFQQTMVRPMPSTPVLEKNDMIKMQQQIAALTEEVRGMREALLSDGVIKEPEPAPAPAPPAAANADSGPEFSIDGKPVMDKRVRMEIARLIKLLGRLKQELASLKHPSTDQDRFHTATSELDMIIASTEEASATMIEQSEIIQEVVQTIEADGPHGEARAKIEAATIEIMQACSFQDLTGQRTSKVVAAFREVEERVCTMVNLWGQESFFDIPLDQIEVTGDAALLNGPAAKGEGLSQDDIDALFN